MISEISPENIICGGFAAERLLSQSPFYKNNYTILKNGKSNRVGKLNDITVFSYKRLFSRMRNRKEYIEFLRTYITEDHADTNIKKEKNNE